MKVFQRKIRLNQIFTKIWDLLLILISSRQFKSPLALLTAYINKKPPSSNSFQHRNGMKISMSSNPEDSVTVVVIFCRNEYGSIYQGDTVIDIGANIGVFSLYAASKGADRIYAFEPNIESYKTLCENIKQNGLEDIIYPFNLAVTGTAGDKVFLPKASSHANHLVADPDPTLDYQEIATTSMDDIIQSNQIEKVDLLKMDCEGSEYDILYNTTSAFDTIANIRLEHHRSSERDNLIEHLMGFGFQKEHEQNKIMWFTK